MSNASSSLRPEAAAPASSTSDTSRKVSFSRSATNRPSASSSSTTQRAPATASSVPSSSTSSSSSAYVAATRRHSLFGTEDRIVLDIGAKYSKFGFSGEPRPRAIVPSVSTAQPSTSFLRLDYPTTSSSSQNALWDLDLERCPNDQLRKGKEALLLAQLTQLLRTAFSQYLMVDPKQRKVLIVENPLLPTLVKDMLCKVLFNNLQVPSVSFIPAPVLSVVAVGKITGLVVDIGYLEASATPVYYGRPMTSHLQTSPRAGERLNRRLKALLLRYAKFVEAQKGIQSSDRSVKERTRKVEESLLTEDVLNEIKAKALFVSSDDLRREGEGQRSASTHKPVSGAPSTSLGSHDELQDEAWLESLRARYAKGSKATPFTFSISPPSIDPNNTASLIQNIHSTSASSSSVLLSSAASTSSSGLIAIPGWVRERAAEVLFETGDQDEMNLIEMTLKVVSSLPIDLRKTMCQNVLVTGGTAMLPGFANRFKTQLVRAVEDAERKGGVLSIERYLHPSSKSKSLNESGSQAQNNDSLNAENVEKAESRQSTDAQTFTRSLSKSVVVLNDPWPDPTTTTSSTSSSSSSSSSKTERIKVGTVPAFAANLLPWMGASLLGALKTSSLTEITREAYDAALSVAEQTRRERISAKFGSEATSNTATSEATATATSTTSSRPPMRGAGNRGSFVGVVGGLETGAFGGLAAVSRHLLGTAAGQPRISTAGSADPGASSGGGAGSSSRSK